MEPKKAQRSWVPSTNDVFSESNGRKSKGAVLPCSFMFAQLIVLQALRRKKGKGGKGEWRQKDKGLMG
jgi:hypothetical protein